MERIESMDALHSRAEENGVKVLGFAKGASAALRPLQRQLKAEVAEGRFRLAELEEEIQGMRAVHADLEKQIEAKDAALALVLLYAAVLTYIHFGQRPNPICARDFVDPKLQGSCFSGADGYSMCTPSLAAVVSCAIAAFCWVTWSSWFAAALISARVVAWVWELAEMSVTSPVTTPTSVTIFSSAPPTCPRFWA